MGTNYKDELLEVGLNLLWRGYSVIPLDSKKMPFTDLLPLIDEVDSKTGEVRLKHSWKPFQAVRATDKVFEGWNDGGAQLGLVCGAISGGLLVIDFDRVRNGSELYYDRWADACEAQGYRVRNLPTQKTGGDGRQVAVRCANPGGNQKLAWVADEFEKSGRKVAIETRGEGGYVAIAPSLHPSGNRYEMLFGQFYETPFAPQERVDAILEIARSLNEVTDDKQKRERKEAGCATGAIEGVIDAYNVQGTTHDELLLFGYTDTWGGRMHRPGAGKTSTPSVVFFEDGRSWHWSSNDELSNGMPQDRFSVRCNLEFGGNEKLAVAVIANELNIEFAGPQPVMRLGWPHCPDHPDHTPLRQGRYNWHCTYKTGSSQNNYCQYRWKGIGFREPPPLFRPPRTRSVNLMVVGG